MNKKAFTLTELIIVIILVSVIYLLAFSNFSFFNTSSKVKLENLKSYLKNQKFENNLKLICLQRENECLILLDNEYSEKIKNPFNKIRTVYNDDKDRKRVYFDDLKVNDMYERVSLFFYLNNKGQHSNYIIETNNNLVVLDSLEETFKTYDNLSKYLQEKEKNIIEVKDAF